MTMMRRTLVACGAFVLLSACAYPMSKSIQTSEGSAIYFIGNLDGASVSVDGVSAGPAIQYDGVVGVLTIPSGSHQIDILRNGSTVLSRDIFLGRGQQLEIKI